MGQFINMKGHKFDKLTVKCLTGTRDMEGRLEWECECKCGNIKIATRNKLRNGLRSCGCLRNELSRVKAKKLRELRRNTHPKARELILEFYIAVRQNKVTPELLEKAKNFLVKIYPDIENFNPEKL